MLLSLLTIKKDETYHEHAVRSACTIQQSMFPLLDLPDGLLPDIASYLPNASAAMLAVALTAPSSSPVWREPDPYLHRPRSPIVAAILDRHEWEDLRFFDFFLPDFARQLVDDDIRAVLVCVNAVTKVKKLYLTGCSNVHGRGLDPLCGSTVLEETTWIGNNPYP